MHPLEHFLAAFIPVVAYFIIRHRRFPAVDMVFVVFIGSQFPDLVDKPLSLANVIPWGRVFTHSLPFAIPIAVVVLWYAVRTDQRHLGSGFVFAYLLHIPSDWHSHLLNGNMPPDMLWPIMSVPPHPNAPWWGGPENIYAYIWSLYSVVLLSIVVFLLIANISSQFEKKGGIKSRL